jgi:hypothetical protein
MDTLHLTGSTVSMVVFPSWGTLQLLTVALRILFIILLISVTVVTTPYSDSHHPTLVLPHLSYTLKNESDYTSHTYPRHEDMRMAHRHNTIQYRPQTFVVFVEGADVERLSKERQWQRSVDPRAKMNSEFMQKQSWFFRLVSTRTFWMAYTT